LFWKCVFYSLKCLMKREPILVVFIRQERKDNCNCWGVWQNMFLKCYQHLHHLSWVISSNVDTRTNKNYSLSIFEMIGCNNEQEEEICQYSNENSWYFENMKCMQRKSTVFNNGDQNKIECFPLLPSMLKKSWEVL